MTSVDMLCLAYSSKHSGRCVAGIDLNSGEWIRPVSAADDGTLTAAACTLDVGRPVRPLDVVRLHLKKHRPAPHQPENWVVDGGDWVLHDEWTVEDAAAHLDPLLESGDTILGEHATYIRWEDIESEGVEASLGLVRVLAPKFEVNPWHSLRARFRRGHQHDDLSCTDLAPWASDARRSGGIAPNTEWYLTVSLAEPWEKDNCCYKIVAAGIEI